MNEIKTRILNKKMITPTVMEVSLTVPEDFSYEPGQFASITVTDKYRRPYTIIEHKDNIIKVLIGVRFPGKGADFFRNIVIDSETEMDAPLGKFHCDYNEKKKVFIAAGTGAAPFIPMIRKALEKTNEITLLYGIKKAEDDIPINYLNDLINENKIRYIRCLSEEFSEDENIISKKGRVTTVLPELELDWKNTDFYICGKNEMILELQAFLQTKEVTSVFIENYG